MKPPLSLSKESDATIESVQQTAGGQAIVEARIKAVLKMKKDRDGHWVAEEIRIGDRPWENLDDIAKALDQIKSGRTREMLLQVARGMRRFLDANGRLPEFRDFAGLVDQLHPKFMTPLIRLDAWERPFSVRRPSSRTIQILSAGPDGSPDTSDDIIYDFES